MRRTRCTALILVFLLSPGAALAQSDEELAKQYYKLGEELYNRADYEGALKQFRQSYQLSHKPALLYNMARCEESLGRHEKAIELLTEYLKSNPDNRTMIEARIANLRRLAKKQPDQPKPPPATSPVTTPPVPPTSTEPTPPPQQEASRPLRLTGWIAIGVGGALLVSGIALGAMAKIKANELEAANRSHEEYSKSKEDTQHTFRNAAIGTLVAGGAVAVTGAVLLILDARSARNERSAWIVPTIGRHSAGLAGQISF